VRLSLDKRMSDVSWGRGEQLRMHAATACVHDYNINERQLFGAVVRRVWREWRRISDASG